jgi:hypothetical protein
MESEIIYIPLNLFFKNNDDKLSYPFAVIPIPPEYQSSLNTFFQLIQSLSP